ARCVVPSFMRAMRLSGSVELTHSSLETFLFLRAVSSHRPASGSKRRPPGAFERETLANPGQGGVVGRFFRGRHSQKIPDRQAIARTPSDPALRADPLEVADQ